MKKKRIGMVLGMIVILLIVSIYIAKKKESKVEEVSSPTGIIDKFSYDNAEYLGIKKNYLYYKKDNQVWIQNLETKQIEESPYLGTYDFDYDSFISVQEDNRYILLTFDGKEIVSSEEFISIYLDNHQKNYYSIQDILYDEKGNQLLNFKDNSIIDILDNYVILTEDYTSYELVSLDTQEKESYDDILLFNESIIVTKNNQYYRYKNNHWETYESLDYVGNGIVLTSTDKKIYVTSDKEVEFSLEENIKENITKDYYIEYGDSCNQIKWKKNQEFVLEDCIESYQVFFPLSNWLIIHTYEEETWKTSILFPNGKQIEVDNQTEEGIYIDAYFVGSYVETSSGTLYDRKGNVKETDCFGNFSYYQDGKYICNDLAYSYFVQDENIISQKYDSITCSDYGYCDIEENGKHGLWYHNQVLIEPYYTNITMQDNFMVATSVLGFDILQIGDEDTLSIEDIQPIEQDITSLIDRETVIQEYSLEDMEDIINENQNTFAFYSYMVLNNQNIQDYQEALFQFFPIMIENQEYIQMNYFLEQLQQLSIEIKDTLGTGIAGQYWSNHIELLKSYQENSGVYYHELMHFLQMELSQNYSNPSFCTKEKCYTKEEYSNLSREEKKTIVENIQYSNSSTLLTEAGAEYYTALYLEKGKVRAYYKPVYIYTALNLIFGYDKMREIYFSSNGNTILFDYFRMSDLKEEGYEEFIELTNKITDFTDSYTEEDIEKVVDDLVSLYQTYQKEDWQEDSLFCFVLSTILESYSFDIENSKYKDIYQKYMEEVPLSIQKQIEVSIQNYFYHYMVDKDGGKIILQGMIDGEAVEKTIQIDYDFARDKVISYEIK